MHYGIEVVTLGDYADPKNALRLAQAAEASGWEGLFVWDHLGFVWGAPAGDPWVILSAVAATTHKIKLGSSVTPLPRRRPQVLAHTLATLDLLSQGRVIFGAGLGGEPQEFAAFGEPDGLKLRAAMLDEGLDLLNRLWSGKPVLHYGTHYTVENVTLAPLPMQRPRIPIWIGGESKPALRRAARWDGWVIGGADPEGHMSKTPQDLASKVDFIRQQRVTGESFEVAITGYSSGKDGALVREYETAGATWWLESLHGYRGSMKDLLDRVIAGPPV